MPAPEPAALIDVRIFRELQDNAGADFVIELVDTFLDEGPQILQTLRSAYAGGDAATFKRAAHSLKSNGQTFGALGFAALARTLELEGLEAARTRGDGALAAIEQAYAEVAAALKVLAHA